MLGAAEGFLGSSSEGVMGIFMFGGIRYGKEDGNYENLSLGYSLG